MSDAMRASMGSTRSAVRPDYDLSPVDCPLCGHAGTLVVPDYSTDDLDASKRVCLDCGTALFVDPMVRPSARTA